MVKFFFLSASCGKSDDEEIGANQYLINVFHACFTTYPDRREVVITDGEFYVPILASNTP